MTRIALVAATLSALAVLAGCGSGHDKVASQVAAKVNGDEITVHQINNALARGGAVAPEQARKVAPQVLETIINQQLLVQKALEAKLDRDPQVVQGLEAARRQILSQAYMEKALAAAPSESKDDVRRFYDQNPDLFQARRVYRFQQIAVAAPPDRVTAIRDEVSRVKTINDVAAWLKSQDMPFTTASRTEGAEQLPMELVPQFARMKDGQLGMIPGPNGAAIIQLVQSQNAPLSQEQATPYIERYLKNKSRTELAEAEIKKLRSAAKIEYVGDFNATRPGAVAASSPAATPAAGSITTPTAAPTAGSITTPTAAPTAATTADKLTAANDKSADAAPAPAAAPVPAAASTTAAPGAAASGVSLDKGLSGLK